MVEEGSSARRYCSVCGYLSSEPSSSCPRCSVSASHVPLVASGPVPYAPEGYAPRAGHRPSLWTVLALLLVLVVAVILATLAADGVFASTFGFVAAPPSTLAGLLAHLA